MLCEQCKEREVTVHLTILVGSSGEPAQHGFCDSCYSKAEEERTKTYNATPSNPLPADVEHITAAEYFEASDKAGTNGADGPAFRHITSELKRFPKTKQRLAMEMLTTALESAEQGKDASYLVAMGTLFARPTECHESPAYQDLLQKIIYRAFDQLANLARQQDAPTFGFGLDMAAMALHLADRERFASVFNSLKNGYGEVENERRAEIIQRIEKTIATFDLQRNKAGPKGE